MRYCAKCKLNQDDNHKHCKDCGTKLEKTKNSGNQPKRDWLITISVSLMVVLLLGIGFVVAGNMIKVPYTAMVTYSEEVPITKVEKYQDSEPYTTQNCITKDFIYDIKLVINNIACIQKECVDKGFFGDCKQYNCIILGV